MISETVFGVEAVGGEGCIQGRIPVLLSDADLRFCEDEAARREGRRHRYSNRPIGAEGLETHRRGVMAEMAAARYYGCDLGPITAFDEGYDLSLKDGGRAWRLQVKATRNFQAGIRLACMPAEMKNSDVFLLAAVHTESGYVELVGLATTRELLARPLTTPNGWRNANHIMRESELRRPRPIESEPTPDPTPDHAFSGSPEPGYEIPPNIPPDRWVDYILENFDLVQGELHPMSQVSVTR